MFKSIKAKMVFFIVLCLVSVTLLFLSLLKNSYDKNINLIAKKAVQASSSAFSNLESNDSKMLSAVLESLITNNDIKKVFLEKDRDKLYQLTAPLFKTLKEQHGITHWYFLNPESEQTCFLRAHKKETFGDVINRATYKKAVETKNIYSGKELGKTAFALRAVHPYYDGNTLIGYMELGEEIEHFLTIMKKQTGNDFGLLISKKYLDEKDWLSVRNSKALKNNWGDQPNLVVVDKTIEDEQLTHFNGDIESIPDGGLVIENIKNNNSVFIRGIFPVYDAANRKVGGVIVLQDITSIYNELSATRTKTGLLVLILMIIISGIIIFALNKWIFKRLDTMIQKLTRVVGGDIHSQITVSSDDEVGKFELLSEQFRTLFVDTVSQIDKK